MRSVSENKRLEKEVEKDVRRMDGLDRSQVVVRIMLSLAVFIIFKLIWENSKSGEPASVPPSSAVRPLIESEKEMASLGIGTVQEVAKAKCGLTVVGISFKNKEGILFGAIAGEGEWSKGNMCKLVMLKYTSHSAFPSSPEYVAVKVEVDGYP